ncbi:putative wall-associated receptor kinase-like 16 isoform X2 [Panicum virgatum]|nr:putative wall-associated receptor kinase-like 16 isoform X2 [Panicum virgatum]KAG2604472.1 hypothetical protein PVAP13_4NG065591 [Panicum virgatum]
MTLPGPNCLKRCGDVDISYPFGIGAGCAMEGFELSCSKTDAHSILKFSGEIPVQTILLSEGQVRIMKHISTMSYNPSSKEIDQDIWGRNLSATPFLYSGKSNMFTVIGVNTLAYMTDNVVTCDYWVCLGPRPTTISWHKMGSAEVPAAAELDSLRTCPTTFNTTYLNTTAFFDEHAGRVPVILNWAVGNETCDIARKKNGSYACLSTSSMCVDSSRGSGYLCNCIKGYEGNPYLPHGCQDIDECATNKPPCAGCINIPGSFYCPSPRSLNVVALAVGSSIGAATVVIAITCTYLFHERKKLAKIKQKYFQQHGGMLLLQEISLKQGIAFSLFTEAELIEATDKFDNKNILGRGGHGTVYKGTLKEGSLIAVKRCVSMTSEQQKQEFGKEMIILSQINHRNIVKLLGCCLEVEVPMLVYEFVPNGTLFQLIHGDNGCHNIPFSTRLRIALESALALAYLHSWASPPILHGDVKSSNILLDENYSAKVSDFGASILAPTDESQFVTLVQGTCGYLDPEYMQTCQLTDKSDVYSFGVVLLELLTGKKAFNLEGPENERSLALRFLCAVKEGRLMDIIDSRIKNVNDIGLLEEVAELSRQCLEMVGERRPAMRDVAEKLDRLSKVMQHPWVPAQHNPEEMESLVGESSVASLEMIGSGNFSMEKRIVQGLLESGR